MAALIRNAKSTKRESTIPVRTYKIANIKIDPKKRKNESGTYHTPKAK